MIYKSTNTNATITTFLGLLLMTPAACSVVMLPVGGAKVSNVKIWIFKVPLHSEMCSAYCHDIC